MPTSSTPSWSAARAGLLGDTGAVDASAQVNQLLGTHTGSRIYQGNAILTPFGSGGSTTSVNGYILSQYDIDQPFTMSGTAIGRVAIPLVPAGNASDLIVSLCPDNSGAPGTPIVTTKIPATWITQLSAVQAAGFTGIGSASAQIVPAYRGNPLALAPFNRFLMGATLTQNWPYPTSGTGGPASGPMSTYYGDYFIQLGGSNGSTFFSDVYTIGYDAAGNLSQAIPQPGLPAPHDGSGAVVVSQDPASGDCTLIVTGGSQSSGSTTNAVYAATFTPATGQIASWSTQAALPATMQFHFMAAWNGYVYAMGGTQAGVGNGQAVYYAQVQNGQIGAWNTTAPLPAGLGFAYSAASNGFVFVCGGFNGSNVTTTYYAPVHADGSLGAWATGPSLPVAVSALDALPCMTAGSYGLAINGGARLMTLGVTSSGPDIAWQSASVPAGGNFFALASASSGLWRYYGILGTSYITMDLALMASVSVPLPATGLANGATYHLLMQSQSGDLNDFVALGVDNGTVLPGAPKYQYRAKGSATWTASAGQAIPVTVYDNSNGTSTPGSANNQVWHTWEDNGARIGTLVRTTTPDQRLIGICEATAQPGQVLNSKPTFTTGTAPWTATNGAIAQSSAQAHGALPFCGLLTPAGGFSNAYIQSEYVACTPGASYTVTAWVYSPTGWSAVFPNLNFYTAGQAFISSGSSTFNVTANTWTQITGTYTAPATAAFLTIDIGEASTPGATNLLYVSAATVQSTLGPQSSCVAQINYPGTWPGAGLWPPAGVSALG